jgi:FkbM family methyltransferase
MKIFDYVDVLWDKLALQRLHRHRQRMMPEVVQFLTSDQEGLSKLVEFVISNEGGRTELGNQVQKFPLEASLFEILHGVADRHKGRFSFSQSGEDLIVDFIFRALRIEKPTYLDIGAYDPLHFSNTAYFYLSGSTGVNVEPNPDQYRRFKELRPKDININMGIADRPGDLAYYLMDVPTLNTFSQIEAERYEREAGHRVVGRVIVPVITLQDLLDCNCGGVFPDFLSLDIEGLEEVVIGHLCRQTTFPKVICIETISYSRGGHGQKNLGLIRSLLDKGYFLYADTYINSVFVRENLWRELKG